MDLDLLGTLLQIAQESPSPRGAEPDGGTGIGIILGVIGFVVLVVLVVAFALGRLGKRRPDTRARPR